MNSKEDMPDPSLKTPTLTCTSPFIPLLTRLSECLLGQFTVRLGTNDIVACAGEDLKRDAEVTFSDGLEGSEEVEP